MWTAGLLGSVTRPDNGGDEPEGEGGGQSKNANDEEGQVEAEEGVVDAVVGAHVRMTEMRPTAPESNRGAPIMASAAASSLVNRCRTPIA